MFAMLENAGEVNRERRAACWANTRFAPTKDTECVVDGGFRLSSCLSWRGCSLCFIVWLCISFFITWRCVVFAMLENAGGMNGERRAACWANTKVSPSSPTKYAECAVDGGFRLSLCLSCLGCSMCFIVWFCILFFITWSCMVLAMLENAGERNEESRAACWANTKVSRSSPTRYAECSVDGGFRLSPRLSCLGRSPCFIV